MKNYILWNYAEAPITDKEKYVWVNGGVYKIWNGVDWETLATDSGRLDPSVLPEDVVYQDDLQKLNEIDEIKAQIPKVFIIYTNIPNGNLTVGRPYGGAYNANTGELVGEIKSTLSNGMTVYWSTENQWVEDEFSYYAIGTFSSSGYIIGDWSDPIPIVIGRDGKDGKDGRDGVDGVNIEFIYKLVKTTTEFSNLLTPYSDPYKNDYIPEGWEDHPSGVSKEYQIEAVCSRKLDKDTQLWGEFTAPTMWSMFGKVGKDGDGVEYIFRVVTEGQYTKREDGTYQLDATLYPPMSEEDLLSVLPVGINPTLTAQELIDLYQSAEFVPGGSSMDRYGWNRGWADDPFSVNKTKPLQFCSQRKYDGETEKWGYFTEPVLWSKADYADNSMFTAFAFTRSNVDLSAYELTGGTTSYPIPDDIVIDENTRIHWYDSVPTDQGEVWMTTRTFGIEEIDEGWSIPKRMTDTSFMQIEYSNNYPWEDKPVLPSLNHERFHDPDPNNPEGINEEAWRDYCKDEAGEGHFFGVWDDDIPDPIFMATCKKVNGVWSDWVVSKIKGEKGDPGKDGKDGLDGGQTKAIRTTVWEVGKTYYDGRTPDEEGNLYLDICTLTTVGRKTSDGDVDEAGNPIVYYQCLQTHTSSDEQDKALVEGEYWAVLDEVGPIHSPLILAENIKAAFIDVEDLAADNIFTTELVANEGFIEQLKTKDITTETITVEHKDDGIVTQITKLGDTNSDYPIWSGGTSAAGSKFSVDYAGNLKATSGRIGEININDKGLTSELSSEINGLPLNASLSLTKNSLELSSTLGETRSLGGIPTFFGVSKSIKMQVDPNDWTTMISIKGHDDGELPQRITKLVEIRADGAGFSNALNSQEALWVSGNTTLSGRLWLSGNFVQNVGNWVYSTKWLTTDEYVLGEHFIVHAYKDNVGDYYISLPSAWTSGETYIICKNTNNRVYIVVPSYGRVWVSGYGLVTTTSSTYSIPFGGQGLIFITAPDSPTMNSDCDWIITGLGGVKCALVTSAS